MEGKKNYNKVNGVGHFCKMSMYIALYTFAEFYNLWNIIG